MCRAKRAQKLVYIFVSTKVCSKIPYHFLEEQLMCLHDVRVCLSVCVRVCFLREQMLYHFG